MTITIEYNSMEKSETEMTYIAVQNNKEILLDINLEYRNTYVAFDNFDRFFDMTSGKDTIQDAVRIMYHFPREEKGNPNSILPTIFSAFQFDDNRKCLFFRFT